MEDADPDSALALQLHRELNGLTRGRSSRGKQGQGLPPHLDKHKQPGTQHPSKPRYKRSSSSSHERPHGKRRLSSDGEGGLVQNSRPRIKKEQPTASDSSNSTSEAQQGEKPARHHTAAAAAHHRAAMPPPAAKHQRHQQDNPKQRHQQQQHEQPQQHHDEQQQQHSHSSGTHSQRAAAPHQPHCAGEAVISSALAMAKQLPPPAAASLVAAHQVQALVRAAAEADRVEADSDDTVKVFFAGVRWGASLPRSALASRQKLAASLNDAFAGDILSVGRGAGLTAVFVDAAGTASQVPALGQRASDAAAWREVAGKAVRVYVRGPVPQAILSAGQ